MCKDLHFSIVLPVDHGGSFLMRALGSLRDLSYPADRFEVLVAGRRDDRPSRAITVREAAAAPFALRYIPGPGPGKAAMLNEACRSAKGRILIFSDDDCRFDPDWLDKFRGLFEENPELSMAGGPDVLEPGGSTFDRALDRVLHSPLVTGRLGRGGRFRLVKAFPKLFNMGITREAAREVARGDDAGRPQIFLESLRVHEDVDLAMRIERSGKRIQFQPDIRVRHYRDTSLAGYLRRNFHLGRTCRRLRVHRAPQTLLSLLVLGAASLPAAALLVPAARTSLGALAAAYGLALAGSAVRGGIQERSFKVFAWIPVLTAGLHFSRGIGYLLPAASLSKSGET